MPGAALDARTGPGGGVIRFARSSLSVRVAVGGAVFLGWDGAEPSPSYALPGAAPEPDVRAVLEPDKDGGWRVVSERLLVTVSRHGTVELRTPGGELLRRDLPPRWWEPSGEQPSDNGREGAGAGESDREESGREQRRPRPGRWMHRSHVPADARFFGLGGRTCGPRLPSGSYRLHESGRAPGGDAEGGGRGARTDIGRDHHQGTPHITMPVQLVVADAGTHLVFHDNPREGRVTLREGVEGRGSGHDRPGSSEIRVTGGPLRYWVLAGPPARVLHGWARLTGAPALPPDWALGHQHSGRLFRSGQRVREVAAQYRLRQLPLRALHVEGDGGRPMLRVLRGERARPAGPPPDADGSGDGSSAGSRGDGVRVVSAGAAPEFALRRSGWAGMQRGGGMWHDEVATGWEGLRESIAFVLGLGLCGVPYSGPGIGGSTAAPSPELYLRWFQLAAYFPLFHAHSAKEAGPREPWAFGPEVLAGCSAAMAERERLHPYFTTLAHLAHRTGAPYVRPLWWQHPRERSLRECGDAFLLGDALLVAPVLAEGARTRRVRLPFGRWYDTVTGASYEGPGQVDLDAPLSRIPVLARAGAAVPVSGADGGIELEVWAPAPGRRGRGLVIRDAGTSGEAGSGTGTGTGTGAETGTGTATGPGGKDVDGGGTRRFPPAERFTVVHRDGVTVVAREDGAAAGYPVRLRS
ncbi:glycoside hydrolase family 31 protein [Streptomyces sp. Amel2xB2]|uniref:glycoside hydrolase family 31 protein n=1 Tax=Streptomyces sp. Amel2xB2 TaxID=1305829 RepID=UPI0015EC59DE|nr:glycoside hydrolase family 31 protein [Streptomyces sp. Amel2xB2]